LTYDYKKRPSLAECLNN
jgi:Ca2+-binding EF-hand superfamily protein